MPRSEWAGSLRYLPSRAGVITPKVNRETLTPPRDQGNRGGPRKIFAPVAQLRRTVRLRRPMNCRFFRRSIFDHTGCDPMIFHSGNGMLPDCDIKRAGGSTTRTHM